MNKNSFPRNPDTDLNKMENKEIEFASGDSDAEFDRRFEKDENAINDKLVSLTKKPAFKKKLTSKRDEPLGQSTTQK